MAEDKIGVNIGGGQNQGVFGAGSVVIENFAIYNRAPQEPATEGAGDTQHPPCPYPGLAYFGPNDSALFFGRDAAIERLTAAVTRQRFTALVGASGSGKSSVVLAGLAPRLHGMGGWRFSHFRLGSELEHNAFMALARALVPLFMASADDIDRLASTRKLATKLYAGELTLRDVFADSRSREKGSRILLIADQFEESFTLIEDEALRQRFIDVLLAGFPDPAAGGPPDISLVLTLRADFYGRALLYRPLADALQGHVENLGPMSREELRAAIVQPSDNAKVSLDRGLVETLLDDVERKPGSLPLLQFALREMWGRQEKRKITRPSYDAIGGVEGALARRAEAIFAEMTAHGANERMAADFQRLFTRLVTPGEGQEDTRRVAERRELGDEVWSLAQRLAGETNRLVVTNAQGPSHETAEVVHEALIRNWPTMAGWIDRDRAFLSWLRQIKSHVELWSANPSDDGPLLRGGLLPQASDWFTRRGDDLSPAERAYIEASLKLRQGEEAARQAVKHAEIRKANRTAFVKIVLAVVALGLAYQLSQKLSDFIVYHVFRPNPPSGNVVIARIDDKSIAELGRWPWGRDVQAQLVRALTNYHAAVVGFDVMLPERDSADLQREQISRELKGRGDSAVRAMLAQSNDATLAEAIRAQGSIYLGYSFSSLEIEQVKGQDLVGFRSTFLEPRPVFYNRVVKAAGANDTTMKADGYLPPIPVLNSAARGVAYLNIDLDKDGEARSYPTVVRFNQRYCVPLFLALVDAYSHHTPIGLRFDAQGVSSISVGGSQIPVDELGRMVVHFRGPTGTIPWFSISDIINHRIPPDALKDRIVLVGLTAHALGDRFVTPVGADFPGVEIQANAADNVLTGDIIHRQIRGEEMAVGTFAIVFGVAMAFTSGVASVALLALIAISYVGYALWLFDSTGTLLTGFSFLALIFSYLAGICALALRSRPLRAPTATASIPRLVRTSRQSNR
jgi:CHASE2 domain-containing sensor protein